MKKFLIKEFNTYGDGGGRLYEYMLHQMENGPGAQPTTLKTEGSLRQCMDEFIRLADKGDSCVLDCTWSVGLTGKAPTIVRV